MYLKSFFKKISILSLVLVLMVPHVSFALDGWIQRTGSGQRNWGGIASSADGQKLIASTRNGYLYTSTDGGETWTERTGPGVRLWGDVSSSADGTKLLAVDAGDGGYPWTSSDSGATWTERTSITTFSYVHWEDTASSADGQKLIIVADNSFPWTSDDGGATWVNRPDAAGNTSYGVTSSADGTKLAQVSDYVYTSTDSGLNWTQRTDSGSRFWFDIASSADGTKLVAVAGDDSSSYIYTSIDSGATWTERTGAGGNTWRSVAMSDDGSVILVGSTVNIFKSIDGGVTWAEQDDLPNKLWRNVALSADGSKAFAAPMTNNSYIYTYGELDLMTVTTGSATPHRNSAVLSAEITLGNGLTDGQLGASDRGFEYGLTASYGDSVIRTGYDSYEGDLYSSGEYSLGVGGLACNTLYHYRAFAIDGSGTINGNDATFTTSACTTPSQILYGVDGAGQNIDSPNLYILDEGTGMKTSTVGEVGYGITGLAFHPLTRVLYAATGGNGTDSKSLFTIDPETGVATLLGAIKDSGNTFRTMNDLAFNSTGVLYGFTGTDDALYTINFAGCNGTLCVATKVGNSGLDSYGNGLAFDSEDNLYLFANGDDSFYKIDPLTGGVIDEITFSNPSNQSFPIAAADFDENDVLYAARLGFGDPLADLINVDVVTGEITSLAPDNEDMYFMDAIAFSVGANQGDDDSEDSVVTSGSSQGNNSIGTHLEGRIKNLILIGDFKLAQELLQEYISLIPNNSGVSLPTVTPLTSNLQSIPPITRTLTPTSSGTDVKALQQLLNTLGFTITPTGEGSPGNETTYFGPLTKDALIRFQEAHAIHILTPLGLTKGTGIFGPMTQAFVRTLGR